MSDYKPGVSAAQAALPNANIIHREHPAGAKGVRISLQEVADRIKKGRNDPRLVAWARQALHNAGGPQTTRAQAQAILTQLKKEVSYMPDPVNTEFMASPAQILCLDKFGLCFKGADCDELCITYCSATLAVGIPTQIIGEKFNNDPVASHVLAAIQDTETGEWLRVDPSTNKPVGQYIMGTGEQWIDPMAPSGTIGGKDAGGDFVGVGRIQRGLGATATTPGSTIALWFIGTLAATAIGLYVYAKASGLADEEHYVHDGMDIYVRPNRYGGWTAHGFGASFDSGSKNAAVERVQKYINQQMKRAPR